MLPLAQRTSKKAIERDHVRLDSPAPSLGPDAESFVAQCAERVLDARAIGRPVVLAFGAHTIKNGLALFLIELIRRGFVTHLATNGAGIIHDWEFSYLGKTSEDVAANMPAGRFGNWQETGFYINLAINVGACEGRGYGESVGAMIETGGLDIPDPAELEKRAVALVGSDPSAAAAAAELLAVVRRFDLPPGRMSVEHPWKRFGVQANAYRMGVPFTGHPMIGHDIIYNHPMNNGTLLGRAAVRDFLVYADSISRLEGGVYISLGSAVMSPMIFEKSLSISRNVAATEGRRIDDFSIFVADLAESRWDWSSKGEPPDYSPDYYLRYNKTFSRMGGTMRYGTIDNRAMLVNLLRRLEAASKA
jgi:hypothetical protein